MLLKIFEVNKKVINKKIKVSSIVIYGWTMFNINIINSICKKDNQAIERT